MPAVLSISSHVAYGHVGNAAAVPALQRMGVEVWPVHTLQYSNHPGHGRFRGTAFSAAHVAEVIAGIAELGVLSGCAAVLSGYLPDAETAAVVADAVASVKAANPDALYCCDPVIGDDETGRYVADGVAEAIRARLVPIADIVVPNGFELAWLAGRAIATRGEALAAAEALRAGRAAAVVATTPVAGAATVETLVVEPAGAWTVSAPRVPYVGRPDGAGDLFAALLLGGRVRGATLADAAAHAAAATAAVLAATAAGGLAELDLIAGLATAPPESGVTVSRIR